MYKFLILLVLLLDWHVDANLMSTDVNQNAAITFEVFEVEVFELNAYGENIVDSVRDYYEDGTLLYQMVYYTDGSMWLSEDAMDIADLKIRQAYVDFKNSHDYVAYEHYKVRADGINYLFPRTNEIWDYANYLYFNAYLDSAGISQFSTYELYVEALGDSRISEVKESTKVKDIFIIGCGILACLGLIALVHFKLNPAFKSETENTS